MALLHLTSPHITNRNSVSKVMLLVSLSLLPALIVHLYFFGYGLLVNVLLTIIFAQLFEALALLLRKKNPVIALSDNSAMLTAILLAFSLPPYAPIWLIAIGCLCSIIIAKHLFGGLGHNLFNPAMVGYTLLLIAYPVQMSTQLLPLTISNSPIDFITALQISLGLVELPDATTGATVLDIIRINSDLTQNQLIANEPIMANATFATVGIEWVNITIALSGLVLIFLRLCNWQAPLAMLVTMTICALSGYDNGSTASLGSVSAHLLSGATMLGAFYIITDPVSGATSAKGRLICGVLVGFLVYIIRSFGNYPDGVAFAILLMNFTAPFIDKLTQPKSYGY